MFETGSGQGGQAPMAMEVQIPVRKMRMVRDISNYVLLNIALGYSIKGNWGAFSMLIVNLPFVQYVIEYLLDINLDVNIIPSSIMCNCFCNTFMRCRH